MRRISAFCHSRSLTGWPTSLPSGIRQYFSIQVILRSPRVGWRLALARVVLAALSFPRLAAAARFFVTSVVCRRLLADAHFRRERADGAAFAVLHFEEAVIILD